MNAGARESMIFGLSASQGSSPLLQKGTIDIGLELCSPTISEGKHLADGGIGNRIYGRLKIYMMSGYFGT